MIVFPPTLLKRLIDNCEKGYPDEACGLIVGRVDDAGDHLVSRLETSANVAEDTRHTFEIDPRFLIGLQRMLRGSADEVIGLYHSHPEGAAQPSRTDLEKAWEPALVWVIASVSAGQAVQVTAHVLVDAATRFEEIPLRTTQWSEYPVKPQMEDGPGAA